jgi:hypothetical protein
MDEKTILSFISDNALVSATRWRRFSVPVQDMANFTER